MLWRINLNALIEETNLGATNFTFEMSKAEEMVLHKPNVSHHYIKNIFTNRLDVTAQLQFLTI